MRAALYERFGAPLTVETVPDPTPSVDGVVVKVRVNGICRSDWHGWQGHDPDITTLPHVPGHELVGEVVAVGREVRRWRIGDRVTVPFSMGCGTCAMCRQGDHQVCDDYYQPGFTGWGAFAEYVALPYADVNLVRVPPEISDLDIASCGCRFSTAFRGLIAQAHLRPGERVAIFGCGGVGLSAIMIAVAAGAEVIAVDIRPEALRLAEQLGAAYTINAAEIGAVPAGIHQLTGGGVHVSMDALGSARTCRDSILSLRKRGRHVQVGLLKGADANPAVPMGDVIGNELELYGSHGMAAHAFDDLLTLIRRGALRPSQLVTEHISLDEAPDVLARMTKFDTRGVIVIDRF